MDNMSDKKKKAILGAEDFESIEEIKARNKPINSLKDAQKLMADIDKSGYGHHDSAHKTLYSTGD